MISNSRRRILTLLATGGVGSTAGCNRLLGRAPQDKTEDAPRQDQNNNIFIETLKLDRFPPRVTPRVTIFTAPRYDSTGTLFGVPTSLTALVGLRNESGQEIEAGSLRFDWKIVGPEDSTVEQFDSGVSAPQGTLDTGRHTFRKQIRSKPDSEALSPGPYSIQLEVVASDGLFDDGESIVATTIREFSVVPQSESPVVEIPKRDLDGDDTPETHMGNVRQMSLNETSSGIKFAKNTIDIVTGLYTDKTIPDLTPDKSRVNDLAANTAKASLSSTTDGQFTISWANHATQKDAGVFEKWYDRAVVTVKIPDSVSIQDSGDADFVVSDSEVGAYILTWITTKVGNGIRAKPPNTFDPNDSSGDHSFSIVSDTSTAQTIDVEYSLSLELGPLRGEPTPENAFGYQEEAPDKISSVYDYEQWQETPKDAYWASVGFSYDSQEVTVPPAVEEAFFDGFEDGNFNGWELVWFENQGPGSDDNLFSPTTNYWDVETKNAIEGTYSMHMIAESYPAARSTEERVLVLDQNFEFSYKYYFEDNSLGGPRIHLWDRDETGSPGDDRLEPGTWGPHLGSAVRPYGGSSQEFRLFDEGITVGDGTFDPGIQHTVRVTRNNDTIVGYHDGDEVISVDVKNISADLSRPYKILVVSGTDSGQETDMWIDSFQLKTPANELE